MSKAVAYLSFLLLYLSGCTTFRAVKCGTPSPESYNNFALDTIATADTIKKILIESPDTYFRTTKFDGGQFHGETIAEYFARVRGNGALLIVRNDSILLEEYFGNAQKQMPLNMSPTEAHRFINELRRR